MNKQLSKYGDKGVICTQYIYHELYNKPSYARILIGSHL